MSRSALEFNYLRQADGAAERNGDPNVVTHPEVDCMDAASHVDLVVQVFTLMHRAEGDNKRKSLKRKVPTRPQTFPHAAGDISLSVFTRCTSASQNAAAFLKIMSMSIVMFL